MMSSVEKDSSMLDVRIKANAAYKVNHYLAYCRKHGKKGLKLVVYGDKEPFSYQMWKSIFRDDLMCYVEECRKIPIPANYTPDRHKQYEKELKEYVNTWTNGNQVIGLYNLAEKGQDPRMHLVLANRRVKQSELERWAQIDKSESMESVDAPQDARFIPIVKLRTLVRELLDCGTVSRIQKYPVSTMSPEITMNVFNKVKHYLEYPEDDEQELKLIVYGDNEPASFQMWRSIFRDDLDDVYYSTFFPLIPIPTIGTRARYEQYENRLRKYMTGCVESCKSLIWGLYNLAAPEQEPRMHLVLVNRRLKRSEFGRWAQTDESELGPDNLTTRQRSLGSPSALRERMMILGRVLLGECSGTESFSAINEACLRELSPLAGGESDGILSSNLTSLVCGEAHQDPRFVPIESLRSLVSNLLDSDPLSSVQDVSSATSSSFTSDYEIDVVE